MTIKLSAYSIRKLKKVRSIPIVRSTLLTDDGPAVGTIWWDSKEPKQPPMIVEAVREDRVWYVDDHFDWLEGFFDAAGTGRYVLIGTEQSVSHSYMP